MTGRVHWAVEKRASGGLTGVVWLAISWHETEMAARRAMAAATRAEPLLHNEYRVRAR